MRLGHNVDMLDNTVTIMAAAVGQNIEAFQDDGSVIIAKFALFSRTLQPDAMPAVPASQPATELFAPFHTLTHELEFAMDMQQTMQLFLM